ncbi:hypothetical protein [Pseudomonas sp. KBW05]|uniref:hypothetical protein n=1 Tax=Pseudomonas sp. KBW05 TaxID=2153360 RepID=UPI0013157D3F|nr:hypothetical protein [Pseudomonas sp. KBW05]
MYQDGYIALAAIALPGFSPAQRQAAPLQACGEKTRRLFGAFFDRLVELKK